MNIFELKQIYSALQPLGLRKSQLHALLPSWWNDSVGRSESGAWEFILLVARRLSLDAEALSRGELLPRGAVRSLQFKHRATIDPQTLQPVTHIASSLAQAVLTVMDQPYVAPDDNARPVHKRIKDATRRQADFEGLLGFCWDSGIPVIPLPNLPVGVRKMDGAVLMFDERPVIVLARKADSKSWLSFILGHELGHIARGHMKPGSSIVDVSLSRESTYAVESSSDNFEREADEFALATLGGPHANAAQAKWGTRDSPLDLATSAREAAQRVGCAAGHLLLRYAFRTRRWAEATVALRYLEEDFDAQQTLIETLAQRVDLSAMSADTRDFVETITGLADAQ